MPKSDFKYVFAGLIFLGISLVIFLILGFLKWPGSEIICYPNTCYCEEVHINEILRERINTLSNVFPMITGCIVLWMIQKDTNKIPQDQRNLMNQPSKFAILYGFLVLFIGVSSSFFHASLTDSAGKLDTYGMNLYVLFYIFYNLKTFTKISENRIIIYYIIGAITIGILTQTIISPSTMFNIVTTIVILFEMLFLIAQHYITQLYWIHRDWKWFYLGLGCFLFGFLIWNLSYTGAVLCNPLSLFQGHSVWHFFIGLASLFFYLYLRSERIQKTK
jgi:hypothetical protein